MLSKVGEFIASTGFMHLSLPQIVMMTVAATLFYLAVRKKYEPLLLIPIGFGMLLANLPMAGLMENGGLLHHLYQGVRLGIYPPLIFLGSGAYGLRSTHRQSLQHAPVPPRK